MEKLQKNGADVPWIKALRSLLPGSLLWSWAFLCHFHIPSTGESGKSCAGHQVQGSNTALSPGEPIHSFIHSCTHSTELCSVYHVPLGCSGEQTISYLTNFLLPKTTSSHLLHWLQSNKTKQKPGTQKITHIGEDVEKWERNVKWCTLCGKQCSNSSKS